MRKIAIQFALLKKEGATRDGPNVSAILTRSLKIPIATHDRFTTPRGHPQTPRPLLQFQQSKGNPKNSTPIENTTAITITNAAAKYVASPHESLPLGALQIHMIP
jgi:hypothetical protein